MTAAHIAAALDGGYRNGGWHRCRCPVHQSNGPTLALRDGPRGLIVHCHAGCSRDDVLAELRRLGLLDSDAGGPVAAPDAAEIERRRAAEERNRQRRIAEALDLWRHETVDPCGTAVERYWAIRGLGNLPIPPAVRAARSWVRHPEGGSRPVMIALVEHVEFRPGRDPSDVVADRWRGEGRIPLIRAYHLVRLAAPQFAWGKRVMTRR